MSRVSQAVDVPNALWDRVGRGRLIQFGVAMFTVVILVGPLLPLIYQAFTDRALYDDGANLTSANFQKVVSSSLFHTAAFNSLIYALLATLVSQFVGATQAIMISKTNMPGKRIIGAFVLIPLFVSPLVVAFGWQIIYGRAGYITTILREAVGLNLNLQSVLGMALIGGLLNAPITFLYCKAAIALSDPSMEDAARICGASPITIMRKITLPLLAPALIFSGMINFTSSLETLSIPLIFGEPAGITLLMPLLYKQALAASNPDYGLVAAASLLLLIVVCLLLYVQTLVLGDAQRYKSVSGKASRPGVFDIGALRWPMAIAIGVFVFMLIVLPMAGIFLRSFVSVLTPLIPIWEVVTLRNYETVIGLDSFRRATVNSVMLSTLGGGIAVFFAAMVALVCYRSEFWLRKQLEYVAMIPRAIPGMIAGIAFLYTILLVPGIGVLRNTLAIFVVAYMGRFLPTALGAIYPSLTQIGPDLDRSSRTMGADWWTACRRILLPLMRPALLSAYVLIFVQTMREYSMALFLVAPGSEVMSISLLQAWAQGEVGMTAAMSTIQTAIIGIFILVAGRFLNKRVII